MHIFGILLKNDTILQNMRNQTIDSIASLQAHCGSKKTKSMQSAASPNLSLRKLQKLPPSFSLNEILKLKVVRCVILRQCVMVSCILIFSAIERYVFLYR